MKKLLLLFLSFALVFISCKQDDDQSPFNPEIINNQDDVAFQQNFGNTMTSNIMGRVIDADGNQINDAQITIGNSVTTTDHNGIFVLNNVSVFENFAYIKASKTGYLNGSRAIVPADNGTNQIIITLLRKNIVGTVDSGVASEVIMDDSKVQFTGGFIDSNGNAYGGQVEVSMHYLKPNAEATFAQMPGMLFAQNLNNDAVGLETYGMLAVNLFTPGGEALNIAEDSPATLEFPVDTEQTAIAPETMNLWFFDETVGYWKEEGSATKVGNKYMAEVSHFSWWNCDLPSDYINVCVSLETENGALANNYFEIIRNETGQTIFSGNTNADGETCGLFPANEQVTIKVYGEEACQDAIIHEEIIGPFSTDTNININFPIANLQQTNITATINTCDGQALTNGYVYIFNNTVDIYSEGLVIPITDGFLDYDMDYCNANVYSIIVYDQNGGQNSGVSPIALEPIVTNLGILSTCVETGAVFEGDVTLDTQEQVDNFGLLGYTGITGALLIGDGSGTLPFIETDIHSLNNLSSLTFISTLNIKSNPSLLALTGFDNVVELDNLNIFRNANLQSLAGLQGLTTIEKFEFRRNHSFSSFSEIPNMQITFSVIIDDTYGNLISLDGLNVANQIREIQISVPGVTSLAPLSNVTQVYSLSIGNCGITSLEGLNNLQGHPDNGSYIRISQNPNLTSLDGLENLVAIYTMLIGSPPVDFPSPNPQLRDFCALQNLVNNGVYNEINIFDNLYDPTVQDIIDGNCAQ